MLHIRRGHADWLADPYLRTMFAARKRVFVDLLHWDVPVVDGGFERDEFDTEHAIYLIICSADGSHLASVRILETERPHLLDTAFADLCDGAPPRSADARELSRFCLERASSAAVRRRMRDELVSGLADYALNHKVRHYTGVAEPRWLDQICAFGWPCAALGPVRSIAGDRLGALAIEITADVQQRLHATGIYSPASEFRDAA